MAGVRSRVELARQAAIRVWRALDIGEGVQAQATDAGQDRACAAPAIVAIGISGKQRYPRRQVTVYVDKHSERLAAVRAALPKRCHGVAIRLEECELAPHAALGGEAERPDLSVGNGTLATCGTLSGFAQRGRRPERYAFSCLHVLAPTAAARNGDLVLQPAGLDGGLSPRDALGILEELELARRSAQRGKTDAALVRLGATRASAVPDCSDAVTLGSPELLSEVWMIGRTSGARRGTVIELNAVARCGQQVVANALRIQSADALPFSRRGDSGALVWDARTKQAVGIVVGGVEDAGDSLVLRLEPVLHLFGLSKLRAFRGNRNLALMLQCAWELA